MTQDTAATRPPPPEQGTHSYWRSPTWEQRFVRRAEADLLAQYGHRNKHARSLAKIIREVRLLHNQAGIWDLVVDSMPGHEIATVAGYAMPVAVALRDLDIGFEHCGQELWRHTQQRLLRPGQRRTDFRGKKDPATGKGLRPSQKPVPTTAHLNESYAHFFQFHAGLGRCISVEVPNESRRRAPVNAVTWYSAKDLQGGRHSLVAIDRAFEDLHDTGLSKALIWHSRRSWFQIIQGAPAIVPPHGGIVWLGRHFRAIEGLCNQIDAKPLHGNHDPYLFPADYPHGFDIESPMSEHQYKVRLARVTGLPGIQAEKRIETGIARLFLRGIPPPYIAQVQGLQSRGALARLENLAIRVLNARAMGFDLGLELPPSDDEVLLARGICPTCRSPQPVAAPVCQKSDCMSPLRPTHRWSPA